MIMQRSGLAMELNCWRSYKLVAGGGRRKISKIVEVVLIGVISVIGGAGSVGDDE